MLQGIKKIEIKRIIDENRSIMLKTSPEKTNIPFKNRRPEQNNTNDKYGMIPKIIIRKAKADIRSIDPSNFRRNIRF